MVPAEDPVQTAHHLVSLHVTGKLGAEDQARFREHLAACAECRAELEFLGEVQTGFERHGDSWLEDHPSPEQIVASVRGELEGLDADRVRRHIGYCATCSSEARWVAGEVAGSAAAHAPKRLLPARTRALLTAVAALALVAVTLTVGRVLWSTPSAFFVPQFLERTQLAGDGLGGVTLEPDDQGWTAYFTVDAPAADFPCTVEVVDAGERTLRSTIVSRPEDLAAGQFLFLSCTRADCPGGAYSIRITASTGRLLETLSFRVEQP